MLDQTVNQNDRAGRNYAPTINVTVPSTYTTHALKPGTQKKMVMAASLAEDIGWPINRLLTVRTAGMRLTGNGGVFKNGPQARCIRDLLDKVLHWCAYRKIFVTNIWVREYSSYYGEHLHIGYHMPAQYDAAFTQQIAKWLDEGNGDHKAEDATIALSENKSWKITGCIRGDTSGKTIATYLGKSEPNRIRTSWGRTKPNDRKKDLHRKQEGHGPIEGTRKHHYRWGTSIGRDQRDRHEYHE